MQDGMIVMMNEANGFKARVDRHLACRNQKNIMTKSRIFSQKHCGREFEAEIALKKFLNVQAGSGLPVSRHMIDCNGVCDGFDPQTEY